MQEGPGKNVWPHLTNADYSSLLSILYKRANSQSMSHIDFSSIMHNIHMNMYNVHPLIYILKKGSVNSDIA